MTDKSTTKRQHAIKELIQKMAISDQKQLVELLKTHYNINTNQAVTSRDLRKLGVVKKMHNGVMIYEENTLDVTKEILKLAVIDIDYNESTIVIKTYPGIAAFVGDCLDKSENLDILGCLAGENVIFVIPKSVKNLKKTYEQICREVHFKKPPSKRKES